jgi:hypothetical protein
VTRRCRSLLSLACVSLGPKRTITESPIGSEWPNMESVIEQNGVIGT